MHATALRCLLAAAILASTPPAGATDAAPESCRIPGEGSDPLRDREGLLAQYERLPRACLQAIFTACTAASSATLLDFSSAAVCSFGYEALLRQVFHGDFGQLMAWWRQQRTAAAR
jgi:hypothetical protein